MTREILVLQFAIDQVLSDQGELTAEEVLASFESGGDLHEDILVWEALEDYPTRDLLELIESNVIAANSLIESVKGF